MNKTLVPFSETRYFPQLVIDYLDGRPELRPFYAFTPDPGSFPDAIRKRDTFAVNREVLYTRLVSQNQKLTSIGDDAAKLVAEQIEKIRKPGTYTITTGHQLNIFTGPLYSVYKILTTIRLATTLHQLHPEFQFIPVFWLASEDHDFEEISSIELFGKPIRWERPGGGATGRMSTSGLVALAAGLRDLVPGLERFTEIFESAYRNNSTLSSATREVMHRLFGHLGLVVLDGDDKDLKALFRDVMKHDLLDHRSYKAVGHTSEILSKWYKPQLHAREINLFYLESGSRERIVRTADQGFEIHQTGRFFSEKAMLDELDQHPERFSPNVVLRPMYQEFILPNLAYIGGPGELSYWLQLREAFEASGVFYPVLMMRACIMLVDRKSGERASKLGIETSDLFHSHDYLVLKVLEAAAGLHPGAESLEQQLRDGYKHLASEWSNLDASLVPAVDAEMQKALNGLRNLEEKARRALKKKNETQLNQVKSLKDKLFPCGELQERSDNILAHLQSNGPELIDKLITEIDPFSKSFMVLGE
jgi:bacillithiol biosynthesis cysteine-adding enzyme BshC